ncbi:hypothetical protein SALBM217S_07751 [Streptomyces griseoloalbus]
MPPVSVCPPGVDDRGAVRADVLAVPDPRLGVDRLADGAEHAQRRQVELGGDVVAPLHERADRGGRRVEDRHAVLLHDLPEAALMGRVRRALVHDLRGAVGERPVDDVRVPGDPADVGRAPVHVGLRLEVEHRPVRVRRLGQVAAGGVQDALRLTRGARGVEDEQRVLGAERLRGVLAALRVDHVVPPHVAALGPGDVLAGAADDEDVLHVVHPGDGLVHGRLQGGRLAAPVAAVGGDDDPRVRVLDAGGERVGRETAEDDRVRGADAGAGQHRDGGLRDHRHVPRRRPGRPCAPRAPAERWPPWTPRP